ncbi:MAG: RecQ family ATP-dependent DNA helicase [Ruminococcus sp.]|nr:RecQ family ATP-dependent DNA helicase [Ruminococcus sp.]
MKIAFIDTEVNPEEHKAYDFGAINENYKTIHTGSANEFQEFISDVTFLCGHNIISHDIKYIKIPDEIICIDTLYLSPLVFPNKPYHSLLKDDKLQSDELNNPLNDAIKAMHLFYDEINAFQELDERLKFIYYMLLKENKYFSGFFSYINLDFSDKFSSGDLKTMILELFSNKICENVPIMPLITESPVELAYCFALLSATEKHSLIPKWVLINYPKVNYILRILRNTSCGNENCNYCQSRLNPKKYLNQYFGYQDFRNYGGKPLQANAINSAIHHESLLAIFPTGGGKSLTFQIPALMAGETERALTVVISPLQSLMKDQVDNLEKKGIAEAVTINGLLSPVERAEAIERVESGIASILYISPESLRSVTIERLFLARHIARFVIDEAHCFSAWGQDFRVDYLYIGDFIRQLQEKKGDGCKIPVSCFTATAKQKVIQDIKAYFKNKLDIELALFVSHASRTNLRYEVLYQEKDSQKYDTMRSLIEQKNCPTIVYVSRTKRTRELAKKLTDDGFKARAFNGKMESTEKEENQEAFMNDKIQIIVATSAFGMGVDKSNVKLVIHYDISDSLENYVQEAGRAGRNETLEAECYILFNQEDLDKHFILLNQTKLNKNEIQQVWRAVINLTRKRSEVCCSPLEIARKAGWDESVVDIETRVKTALQALENAGYLRRGKNVPRIYATSILAKNMTEASEWIDKSLRITNEQEKKDAKRIIHALISSKNIANASNADAESRIDYLADRLGIEKRNIIRSVQMMKEDGLLADEKDLTAYIFKTNTENKSLSILNKFQALEEFILAYISKDNFCMNYKELNESALAKGIKSSIHAIKTLFYYWTIRSYIQKQQDSLTNRVIIEPKFEIEIIIKKRTASYQIAEFIIRYLFHHNNYSSFDFETKEEVLVGFSILEILNAYQKKFATTISTDEIEEALLFLSKINAIKLEGGFLVLYNAMHIKRLELNDRIQYKKDDYKQMEAFYKQRIAQIHIVGEYANIMIQDNSKAIQFVNDYFQMDYKKFLSRYFSDERRKQIEINITPAKYHELFHTLSERQLQIIHDNENQHIVVSAGPGSGKTKVLVHKLASLLLLEDVKHEQLLMLTFSRAAVMEFKQRLHRLIGNASNYVEIKTFHSYCFDILGKIGNIKDSDSIVKDAGNLIRNGEADLGKITKTVLVIDEAQDMDENEFQLIEALLEKNETMRIIAVGDDDQNIYQFRGSDSKYLKSLITNYYAVQYSLIDNYRSCQNIIAFANAFVKSISNRMKTENILPVSHQAGEVKLIKHTGMHIETAIVNDIMATNLVGTTCILTNTNRETLMILGLLKQKKISAKLIQSSDEFDMYHIIEIQYFLRVLKSDNIAPVISDEKWNYAIDRLKRIYSESECLPVILEALTTFAITNEKKYFTDFMMFLQESKIEDFYKSEQDIITISTMHKSKGREFDNVFLMLDNINLATDEQKRKLYVGITRAKSLLHIHYTGNLLDSLKNIACSYKTDLKSYQKPSELIMQLSHKDVFLDFFKDKLRTILGLRSGMHLCVIANTLCLCSHGNKLPVLQFSSACYKKIKDIISAGYKLYDAKIRFICTWKDAAIILPDIYFKL